VSRAGKLLIQVGFLAFVALAWELASRTGIVDSDILPPFSVVMRHVFELLFASDLWIDLLTTISEVLLAVLIACPIGLAVGMILAENAYLREVFRPFFFFGLSVPKSIFLPIFMLLLGIGFSQKTVFGFFQAIFPLVIITAAAAETVPKDLLRLARASGATRWQTFAHIQWPAMLPLVLESIRLALLFAITGIMFAEMTAAQGGLGARIFVWGQQFQMADLIAGILIAGALGMFFNETIRYYERRLGKWRQ
jgi:NitT/TauT family transport system permease protein